MLWLRTGFGVCMGCAMSQRAGLGRSLGVAGSLASCAASQGWRIASHRVAEMKARRCRHTAYHEAGHVVIGRALGITCGRATGIRDPYRDRAQGHSKKALGGEEDGIETVL